MGTLTEKVAESVAARGDALAVVAGDGSLSYRELAARAAAVASSIVAARLPAGPIAVVAREDLSLVPVLLGVLQAGRAYLPVDPRHPPGYNTPLVDGAAALVCDPASRQAARTLATPERPVLELGAPLPLAWPSISGDDPAYLLQTSGTTGAPRRVTQTHGRAAHLMEVFAQRFRPGDGVAMVASATSDAHVMDVFGTLFAGATLHLCPSAELGAAGVIERLEGGAISVLHATPTVMRDLLDELGARRITGVRLVVLGGEAAFGSDAALIRAAFGEGVTLVNGLGLSECSLVLQHQLSPGDPLPPPRAPLPVGRPVRGVEVRLLTPAGEQRAPWGEGELELTGPLADAEGVEPGPPRRYLTGDLLQRRPDGSFAFVGRRDFQVKIRGHRVVPAEVETALRALPDVTDAVVVPFGERDHRALAGFAVGERLDGDNLRAGLRLLLPLHLQPARLEILDELPRLPGGKVNRARLAALAERPAPAKPVEAPSALALTIARIFRDVLGAHGMLDPARGIGVDDDFFALGGHSLIAVRLVARLARELGVEVALPALFAAPTPAQLARSLRGHPAMAPIPPLLPDQPPPLSSGQRRLWFLDRLAPGDTSYIISFALQLPDGAGPEEVRHALGAVVRRQQVLTASFVEEGGELLQRPANHGVPLTLADDDASLRQAAAMPFDLARGPLWRAVLAPPKRLLLFVLHHALLDRWSIEILRRDFSRALAGEELPPLPVQYRDYSAWERALADGPLGAAALRYFSAVLAGAPTLLALPTDHPRPPLESHRGALAVRALETAASEAARRLGREHGASLFVVLLTVFELLLHRYTAQETILVGVPFTNRGRPDLEEVVGFFINTLPVRADFAGRPSFRALLLSLRQATLKAAEHQSLPFDRLVAALNPPRSPAHAPLFQVAFQLIDRERLSPGLAYAETPRYSQSTAKFDLTLSAVENADRSLSLQLEYAVDLFEPVSAEWMLAHFHALLWQALTHPDAVAAELPMSNPAEQVRLAAFMRAPTSAPPSERLLHQLVAEQAARTPDAVALVADEELSYAELMRRSRALAAILRERGVGPERLVGICAERTARAAVAMLAVLQAGGAWVPLDPAQPAPRLGWLAADTRLTLILADERGAVSLPALDVPVLPLDVIPPAGHLDVDAVSVGANLAYVIFTSGSTGRPKGIAVTHRGIVNNLLDLGRVLRLGPGDRLLAVASFSFDLSVVNLFATWAHGGTVVLLPTGAARDPAAIAAAAERAHPTILSGVPTVLAAWLGQPPSLPSVRAALIGGERIPPQLRRRLEEIAPGCQCFSIGGATEASVCSVLYPIGAEDATLSNLPYGHAMEHQRLYVLDPSLAVCPVGVPGELYLAGIGLARGYHRRPALTAARFLPDPWGAPGERMYATGDRVRWRDDGELEILGRLDRQVKLRGIRIELGEVEAALREVGAGEAAVVVREGRLVGFVAGSASPDELRRRLLEQLPSHLVPSQLVVLPALPRTPSGKLDYEALALRAWQPAAWMAPRTPVEARLALVWSELLGVERVGAFDDFFALGGHSLLAAALAARVRADFDLSLPLHRIFAAPTLAAMAEGLAPEEGEAPLGPRGEDTWPLSRAQLRALTAHSEAVPNVIHAALIVPTGLEEAPLARAFAALLSRHRILRARFGADGSDWRQWIGDADGAFRWTQTPPADAEAQVATLVRAPWSLEGPQLRLHAFRSGPDETRLLWSFHHAVADGASLGLLLAELLAGCAAPRAAPMPSLEYADFAAWERALEASPRGAALRSFWRERLEGACAPRLGLPAARAVLAARRALDPGAISPRGDLAVELPRQLLATLQGAARRLATTPFLMGLTATLAAAADLCEQDDLTVISPWSRRDRSALANLIGPLAHGVVVRARLPRGAVFADQLAAVDAAWRESLAQAALFDKFLGAHHYRFKVNYLAARPTTPPTLPWPVVPARVEEPFWDAGVTFEEDGDELHARFSYNRDLVNDSEARRWAQAIAARLTGSAS